jgi:hypothetical protein
MILDPFDAPAACEKLFDGFLSRVCIDLGRHDALPVDPSGIRTAASDGCTDRLYLFYTRVEYRMRWRRMVK